MIFLPVIVGVALVLQGGLNRVMAESRGLALTLLLNSLVVTALTLGFYAWAQRSPSAPTFLRGNWGWQSWYVVPALCGFVITLGIPWALSRIGAGAVFAVIIATQLAGSLAWDAVVEHRPLGAMRIVAAVITAIGALLFVNT